MLVFALVLVLNANGQDVKVKISVANKQKLTDIKDENGKVIGKKIVNDTIHIKTKGGKDSILTKTSLKIDTVDNEFTSVDFTTANWLRDPLTVHFRNGRRTVKFVRSKSNKKEVHQRYWRGQIKYPANAFSRFDSAMAKPNNYPFAGLRLLFEPQFGTIFQTNTNRLDKSSIAAMPKFGLETNVWGGWVTLQTFVIFPIPSVSYDSQSPINNQGLLVGKTVNVDFGVGWGLSFLDGIFAIGWATLHTDPRGYNTTLPSYTKNLLVNPYIYFNIQTISAVRKILKGQAK